MAENFIGLSTLKNNCGKTMELETFFLMSSQSTDS